MGAAAQPVGLRALGPPHGVRLVDEDDLYGVVVGFKTEAGPVDVWGRSHDAYRFGDGYVLTWLRVRTPGQAAVAAALRTALARHDAELVAG